jgi:proteasome lid subunit RPN8/RPN11
MVLTISKLHLEFLARLAEREYPRESCAVLLGRQSGEVNAAVWCANVHPEPLHHYAIDPKELIRLQRIARTCGLQIVGFHHSHPEHRAVFSERDLQEAHWPGCVYVITAVRGGRVCETRAYLLHHGKTEPRRFAEIALEIANS